MNVRTIFIIAALCLLCIAAPASAVINITIQNRTSSYITWEWASGLTIINESIDGFLIYQFDPHATTFTLSDLPPSEEHTFRIYTAADSGTNTTSTLPENTVYSQLVTTIVLWILVLIIAVMFICGTKIHWLFFWFGSGIALYGIIEQITRNVSKTGIDSLLFWIYIALFIMGFILWLLRKRKGF